MGRARPLNLPKGCCLGALLWAACGEQPVPYDGLLGQPIPLMSGDGSPLPRVAFIDEGCPGSAAAGGCGATPERACRPLLIDTLAPLTGLKAAGIRDPEFHQECLEIRAAANLAGPSPDAATLAAAVSRFRFHDLPLIRAPDPSPAQWSWRAGAPPNIGVDGVLGANLLHQFAVVLRTPASSPATLSFYAEFPGSDADLADQGRAFIPVQFPGRLLGRDPADRCDIGGDDCRVPGFDLVRGQPNYAIAATRMVLDACVAPPPCTVRFDPGDQDSAIACSATIGPLLDQACLSPVDPVYGGQRASLIVATSVPGVVLFADSARRMFGDIEALPPCDQLPANAPACLRAVDGALAVPGWPIAQGPLPRLAIRSLALVPGLTLTRGSGPCERTQARQQALLRQCERYLEASAAAGDVRNTTPPYSARDDDASGSDPADTALAILGEPWLSNNDPRADTELWLEAVVLPETHAIPVALRLDVAPEAIQPDGLLGTALLAGTETVLDYTDPNPAVRVSCLEPDAGNCLVAPECSADAQSACCYGLPLNLLVDFITRAEDETCCGALSPTALAEIQDQGLCAGV